MKKLIISFLTISLVFLSTLVKAQTNYYVDSTSGSDANNGTSIGTPWKTMAWAVSHATGSPSRNVINIGSGTYPISSRLTWPINQSWIGVDSNSTILKVTFTANSDGNDAAILGVSAEGTEGKQSIRNLAIDGNNYASNYGVLIRGRSKDTVSGVKFTKFSKFAITFNGNFASAYRTAPATYATGNVLSNSSIRDCYPRDTTGGIQGVGGNMRVIGNRGFLLTGNIFHADGLLAGQNNDVLYSVGGFNKGMICTYNKFYKPKDNGNQFNFIIESWYDGEGTEIAYNEFWGGSIDIGTFGSPKGNAAYSNYIHDNLFKLDAQFASTPSRITVPIEFEDNVTDWVISNNTFENTLKGVVISLTHNTGDVNERGSITNNTFKNVGLANNGFNSYVIDISVTTGLLVRDINIYNNTIISGISGAGSNRASLYINASGVPVRNIKFINNIVQGGNTYGYLTFAGTSVIDSITTKNNCLYLNSNSNTPYYVGSRTITHLISSGNLLATNPLVVSTSDFHLQGGSPCIDAGTFVGLSYNANFPDIGAYESGAAIILSNKSVFHNNIIN